jgi:hypothetical protein
MVSKCANPTCSVPFRYFHQGKLFRLETVSGPDRRRETLGATSAQQKKLEFYWLCDDCSERFTLVFEATGVTVRSRGYVRAAAS